MEPPVIVGTPAFGNEDASINLTVSVRQTDGESDSNTEVIVKDVPAEAYITVGSKIGNDWYVPLDRVPEMAIVPALHDDVDFILTIIATTTRSLQEASRQITVPVAVEAVADPAVLTTSAICFELLQRNVSLNISVEATDKDGSEDMIITASSVPENMILTPAIDNGSGSFVILPEDVPYLILIAVYDGLQPANISVTVETVEVSNDDTAVVIDVLEVTECPRIPLPPTTIQPPTTISPANPTTKTTPITNKPTTRSSPTGPTQSPGPSEPSQSPGPSEPTQSQPPTHSTQSQGPSDPVKTPGPTDLHPNTTHGHTGPRVTVTSEKTSKPSTVGTYVYTCITILYYLLQVLS